MIMFTLADTQGDPITSLMPFFWSLVAVVGVAAMQQQTSLCTSASALVTSPLLLETLESMGSQVKAALAGIGVLRVILTDDSTQQTKT